MRGGRGNRRRVSGRQEGRLRWLGPHFRMRAGGLGMAAAAGCSDCAVPRVGA